MADDFRNENDPRRRLPPDDALAQPGGDASGAHSLPPPQGSDDAHRLPWPAESDPSALGERFEHGASPEQRGLGDSFARRNDAAREPRELGREFADPHFAADQRLGQAFADPNAQDDTRLGKSFEESNSSRKKRKPPVTERVHKPRNLRPMWVVLAAIVLLAIVGGLIGWLPRHNRDKKVDQQARDRAQAKPIVEAQRVVAVRDQEGLVLPGTTIPLTEAYVYARASGYLTKRYADIGDHVIKGQILGVIDAPDLNAQTAQAKQELDQAERQLDQQRAQLALATVTVNRWRVLVAKGVFSRQDGDTQETNYASSVANVAAAQRNVEAYRANLQRAQAYQDFEYVRAPFNGVVTQRNVDVGALIASAGANNGQITGPAPVGQTSVSGGTQQAGQANTGGTSGMTSTAATPQQSPGQGGPLFGIAEQKRLRILVSVPEGYVGSINPGGHASLHFDEYPAQEFTGDITRTADSLDPNTRTMLTEVQVDNRAGKLKSGMYAVVTFPPQPGLEGPLLVNGEAIVIRNDQSSVAKVVNGKVQIVPVKIGRDFGSATELVSGVQAGDVVVTQVTDDVVPGAPVQVHLAETAGQQVMQPPPQNAPPGGDSRYGNIGITDQNIQNKSSQQNSAAAHGHKGGKTSQSKPSASQSNP